MTSWPPEGVNLKLATACDELMREGLAKRLSDTAILVLIPLNRTNQEEVERSYVEHFERLRDEARRLSQGVNANLEAQR